MAIHNNYPNLFEYLSHTLYNIDILSPDPADFRFVIYIYEGDGSLRDNFVRVVGASIEECFAQLEEWAVDQLHYRAAQQEA